MRISDWSSDVCSSDLARHRRRISGAGGEGLLRLLFGPAGVSPLANPHLEALRVLAMRLAGHAFYSREGVDHQIFSPAVILRSEGHTSELQSLMRISYAVFCLKKNNTSTQAEDESKKAKKSETHDD